MHTAGADVRGILEQFSELYPVWSGLAAADYTEEVRVGDSEISYLGLLWLFASRMNSILRFLLKCFGPLQGSASPDEVSQRAERSWS